MKLVKRAPEVLFEGDKITVAVTHQANINGEDSWVRYEAQSSVQPGETATEAERRMVTHVTQASVRATVEAAKVVQQLGGTQ